MKPAAAISAVVIAVLATVVIEETRIKKLNDEIDRLRALPDPPPAAPAADPAPVPAETADTPVADADTTPAEMESTPDAPAATGFRQVPSDYPEPDDERVQELALDAYSRLHYELGLTNRERAFFDDIFTAHELEMRELAGRWLEALPADRPTLEGAMEETERATLERIRRFLDDEDDYATFAAYHAMQPEREVLAQIAPIMDQQGVVLELDKELALIEAMHKARESAGGIDWNSPAAIKVIASPDALETFEKDWAAQTEALQSELGEVLEEKEAEAFLAAREQLKAVQIEAIQSAIEATQ